MKISTLLIKIVDKTEYMIKYQVDTEDTIRTYHPPIDSEFDYEQIKIGQWYVLRSEQEPESKWYWKWANRVDRNDVISKRPVQKQVDYQ